MKMASSENKTARTLAALGATQPAQVSALFLEVRTRFDSDSLSARDESSWKQFRDAWLGRKSGVLTQITDNWLKPATADLKRIVGAALNELRAHVESQIEERFKAIEEGADEAASARERVDLSLPGVVRASGSHHLIRQVFQQIEDIFFSIGFSIVEGPEIETPYYNFEALNIPEFHPVRDDMDTFYIDLPKGAPGQLLLRTHTSPMQIRTMEKRKPPVRIIVPGKVYRRDNPDATHSFIFHQVEGLAVDSDITFCDFTGTIEYFVKQFFGPSVKTRFRSQSRCDSFFHLPSSGRPRGGLRHYLLRFHRHHRVFRQTVFWPIGKDPLQIAIPMRLILSSSIKWKASRWTPTLPFAISPAPSSISSNSFLAHR